MNTHRKRCNTKDVDDLRWRFAQEQVKRTLKRGGVDSGCRGRIENASNTRPRRIVNHHDELRRDHKAVLCRFVGVKRNTAVKQYPIVSADANNHCIRAWRSCKSMGPDSPCHSFDITSGVSSARERKTVERNGALAQMVLESIPVRFLSQCKHKLVREAW